jgi:hypothetical protein
MMTSCSGCRDTDAEVSEEAQEAAARRLIPAAADVEVIRDTGGHRSGATANRDGYRELLRRIEDPTSPASRCTTFHASRGTFA